MVTKLYYFKSKRQLLKWCRERNYSLKACEEAWSGSGYYYARGRSHISKHVPHLDKRRGGRVGGGPWRHTHDLASRLKRSVEKASARAAGSLARRAGLPRRAKEKLARAIAARTLSRTVKAARRLWARIPAVKRLAEDIWGWIPRRYREGRHRAWTYIAALALAYSIYKRARERGVDPYQYDWEHLIDWSLGYRHAKQVVREALGKTLEELQREGLERWRSLRSRYAEGEWARAVERELDEIAKYELEHLDELIAL
ncbi:MAG: hypothetical protein GSR80_000120 [Desulfurococcales archaeon]|nr:hypothetical protein [Desulfurococcales archaeon]